MPFPSPVPGWNVGTLRGDHAASADNANRLLVGWAERGNRHHELTAKRFHGLAVAPGVSGKSQRRTEPDPQGCAPNSAAPRGEDPLRSPVKHRHNRRPGACRNRCDPRLSRTQGSSVPSPTFRKHHDHLPGRQQRKGALERGGINALPRDGVGLKSAEKPPHEGVSEQLLFGHEVDRAPDGDPDHHRIQTTHMIGRRDDRPTLRNMRRSFDMQREETKRVRAIHRLRPHPTVYIIPCGHPRGGRDEVRSYTAAPIEARKKFRIPTEIQDLSGFRNFRTSASMRRRTPSASSKVESIRMASGAGVSGEA